MRRLGFVLVLALCAGIGSSALGQERVRNGTFDRDLANWDGSHGDPRYGVGEPTWISGKDAQGDPRSGSAYTGWSCSSIHFWCLTERLSQCVPVRPGGTYRLSVVEQGSGEVTARWYSSPDCTTGDLGVAGETALRNEAWSPWEALAPSPTEARSVRLTLESRVDSPALGAGGGASWDDVSLTAVSEPAASSRSLLIPTAASSGSLLGADFRTRLTLLSLGSSRPAPIRLQVLPPEGKEGPSRTFLLTPGVTTVFDDVLREMGYEGGAAIVVAHAGDQPLYATAEVYADSAGGRHTTPVPVLADPSSESRAVTPGVDNTASSRTNLACANVGDRGWIVRAEVHAADGSKLGNVELAVSGHGWTQKPIPFLVSGGYVRWGHLGEMNGQPPDVSCFAIVVDNGTNDGSLFR